MNPSLCFYLFFFGIATSAQYVSLLAGMATKKLKKNSRESPPTQRGKLLGPVRWDLAIAGAFI